MKNLGQIKVINKILENDKKNHLLQLGQVNHMIERKIANLKKILLYKSEYTNKENLTLTRRVPALSQNLENFTQKISDLITKEESEITKLQQSKKLIIEDINKLDNKINVMQTFADRAKNEIRIKKEQIEQSNMDDLVSNKKTRGEENG